jgi:hypothetical protein
MTRQEIIPRGAGELLDLRTGINDAHAEAERAFLAGMQHVFRAGELLLAAKVKIPHGEWEAWLAANIHASARTCRGYMQLAALGAEERRRVADLPLREALRTIAKERRGDDNRATPEPRAAAPALSPPTPSEPRDDRDMDGEDSTTPAGIAPASTPPAIAVGSTEAEALITELRTVAAQFITDVRHQYAEENLDRDYSLNAFAVDLLCGDHDARSLVLPIICRMLGIPADPWPGLTRADIKRMTRGRQREAARLGLTHPDDFFEPQFAEKAIAAANREWLESKPDTPKRRSHGKTAGLEKGDKHAGDNEGIPAFIRKSLPVLGEDRR